MPVSSNNFSLVSGTPLTPQFAEIVIRGHSVESDGGSKPFVNILHFIRTAGPGTGTELQLLSAVMGIIAGDLSNALSVTYLPDDNTCRFMDDPINLGSNNANPIAGTAAGDRLPNFNAVVIRKNTFARGQSYRGSNHWGPIAESQTLLDNIGAGSLGLWNAIVASFGGLIGAGFATADLSTWKLCVLSTTLSNLSASPILATGSVVRAFVLNIRLGTMKRRKDKTGPSN